MPDSSISKLFEKSRKERLDIVGNFANLSNEELDILPPTESIEAIRAMEIIKKAAKAIVQAKACVADWIRAVSEREER